VPLRPGGQRVRGQQGDGAEGQRYLVPGGGHAPVREDDGRPLVGHRVIGEALDGDLAGLGPRDTCVVDADHVAVGRHGTKYPRGRPEVPPVDTQERAQLP